MPGGSDVGEKQSGGMWGKAARALGRFLLRRVRSVREGFQTLLFLFTLAAVGYGLWVAIEAFQAYGTLAQTDQFKKLAYTDTIKEAVAIKVESSKGLAQATLILIGVLWGMIVTKKEERVLLLSNWVELVAFLVANALLLASMYMHTEYAGVMAATHTAGVGPLQPKIVTILDFTATPIQQFYSLQMQFLVGGLFLTGAALFSAHLITAQENPKCNPPASSNSAA